MLVRHAYNLSAAHRFRMGSPMRVSVTQSHVRQYVTPCGAGGRGAADQLVLMPLLDQHVGMIVAGRLLIWVPMDARQPVIREQQVNGSIDGCTAYWTALTAEILIELLGAKRLSIPHDPFQDGRARLGDPVSLIAQMG